MLEDHSVRRLAVGFAVLTALTYGLIVLGALVRAHGAGLACPDWPLCFGQVLPRLDLKVAFEWSHRAVAGSISLVFAGLAFAVLRDSELRRQLGTLIGITTAILALQILLGALTVWQLLASWTVTSHLLTGNAFAVSLALIWRALARRSQATSSPRPAVPASARIAVSVASVLLLAQMTLGGLVSSTYAGLACPDWPTCMNGSWFPSFAGAQGTHLLHRMCGYALLGAIAVAFAVARNTPGLGRLTALALALGVAQVGVGVANVLLRIPVEITGLHSALAAALVLVTALALAESWERRAHSAHAKD